MENKNPSFNMYPNSEKNPEYTFSYNSSNHFDGQQEELYVNVKKADEAKKTIIRNILEGNSQISKFEVLIKEDEQKFLEEVGKAIHVIKGEYIPGILQGVEGRIHYLLKIKNNTDAFQTLNEIDKISKDITYYQEKSPNDSLLMKDGVKQKLTYIATQFNDLISLYQQKVGFIRDKVFGQEFDIKGSSENLTDENFIQQATDLCLEASDLMMDIETLGASENLSKTYSLLDGIKEASSKEIKDIKIDELKSVLQSELDA